MNAKNNRFKGTKGPEVMSLSFGAECLPLGKPRLLHGWVRSLLKRQKPFLRTPGMGELD